MAAFLIGDNEFNGRIVCDGNIDTECHEFTNYGSGVDVLHLYVASGYIDTSPLVLHRRPIGSTEWEFSSEWTFGGYEGDVYMNITINVSDYEYKSTYKGLTKYYTIFGIEEPCPNIVCNKIELIPMTCYQGDHAKVHISGCSVSGPTEGHVTYEWFIDGVSVELLGVFNNIIDTTSLSIGTHKISGRAKVDCGSKSNLLSINLTVKEVIVDPCENVLPDWICEKDINGDNTGWKIDQNNCHDAVYDVIACTLPVIDPCEGVLPDWICEKDINGDNTGWKIDQNNCHDAVYDVVVCPLPVIDPCEGITCNTICVDYDLYSQKCVDSECTIDTLIEENSVEHCGYVEPVEPSSNITKLVLPIGLGLTLLELIKK